MSNLSHNYGDSDSDNDYGDDTKRLHLAERRCRAFEQQRLKQAVAKCKAAGAKKADVAKADVAKADVAKAADAKTADVAKAADAKQRLYFSGLYFALFPINNLDND